MPSAGRQGHESTPACDCENCDITPDKESGIIIAWKTAVLLNNFLVALGGRVNWFVPNWVSGMDAVKDLIFLASWHLGINLVARCCEAQLFITVRDSGSPQQDLTSSMDRRILLLWLSRNQSESSLRSQLPYSSSSSSLSSDRHQPFTLLEVRMGR